MPGRHPGHHRPKEKRDAIQGMNVARVGWPKPSLSVQVMGHPQTGPLLGKLKHLAFRLIDSLV